MRINIGQISKGHWSVLANIEVCLKVQIVHVYLGLLTPPPPHSLKNKPTFDRFVLKCTIMVLSQLNAVIDHQNIHISLMSRIVTFSTPGAQLHILVG